MPYEPDDHPGPTKFPPPDPEGEPMVGRPATLPDDPAKALRGGDKCVSFAAAARRKRRFGYSRRSAARPSRVRDAAPAADGVVVLRTYAMRLRFGADERFDTPAVEPT